MINRKVVIAGASGLVGSYILQYLLQDTSVSEVHALCRRDLDIRHPKLTIHVVDFSSIPPLPPVDEIYLALGTTIRQAGNRSAFRAVDFTANWAVAQAGFSTGARRLGLVSAMSASSQSLLFYNRVKGELEDAITTLPFESLVIARPSFLLGSRAKLNQPTRYGEKIGIWLTQLLNPLLPTNYRAVEARKVARSLVLAVSSFSGRKVLLSGDIQKFD
jgi:uncharacterized protein YbjT (DUF2867 family)